MKNTICLTLLLISLVVEAQHKPGVVKNYQDVDNKAIHFGFSLGMNTSDFTFIRSDEAYKETLAFADVESPLQSLGFNVHIVSEFRLNKYFSLRFTPGLILTGERNIEFIETNDTSGVRYNTGKTAKLESNYLDFPLHIKYSAKRINNYRPYVLAGVSTRYDLVARKNYETQQIIKLRKSPPIDIFYDFGFGMDFYLVFFKFSSELKISTGMMNVFHTTASNEINYQPYFDSLEGLRSTVIMLSFNFE